MGGKNDDILVQACSRMQNGSGDIDGSILHPQEQSRCLATKRSLWSSHQHKKVDSTLLISGSETLAQSK